jgi:hypothetical protein
MIAGGRGRLVALALEFANAPTKLFMGAREELPEYSHRVFDLFGRLIKEDVDDLVVGRL